MIYPEHMRIAGTANGDGMFRFQRHGLSFGVIASAGEGWDHVSVSTTRRCPTWDDMEYARSLFFEPDAVVMQLHVPASDHINVHPFCLHMWRPHNEEIPRPPAWMVGPSP